MRTLIISLSAALFTVSASQAAVYSLSGAMDPLQAGTNGGFGSFDSGVVGAGDGMGMIAGSYDDSTKILNYTLTWQDLTGPVTNLHFHNGAVGVPGGVDVGVAGPWASPQTGGATLGASQEANLLAGNWYVNVHTGNFGGGEIRGQVVVTPVPEPSSLVLMLGGIATLLLRRRRA